MSRWSLRAALFVCAALVGGGCSETFTAPEKPDLYKVPYDLGLGRDISVDEPGDLAKVKDLSGHNGLDLHLVVDLFKPDQS